MVISSLYHIIPQRVTLRIYDPNVIAMIKMSYRASMEFTISRGYAALTPGCNIARLQGDNREHLIGGCKFRTVKHF